MCMVSAASFWMKLHCNFCRKTLPTSWSVLYGLYGWFYGWYYTDFYYYEKCIFHTDIQWSMFLPLCFTVVFSLLGVFCTLGILFTGIVVYGHLNLELIRQHIPRCLVNNPTLLKCQFFIFALSFSFYLLYVHIDWMSSLSVVTLLCLPLN